MKVMYTRPEDNGVSIVIATSKPDLEKVLGPLTQEQYEEHILERSVPEGALQVKIVAEENIPSNREFRNAWVDITDDNNVNIDLAKAKELQLTKLRELRNRALEKLDKDYMIAIELGTATTDIKAAKQQLRDITEDLKNLVVSGVDDEEVLTRIKELGYEGGHILLTGKA
jgi:hypothetical protein